MEEGAPEQENKQESDSPSIASPAITPAPAKAGTRGGKRRTNLEREEIKMKIHPMMASMDPRTISEKLGMPLSTVYKYISEIADETHKERLKKANVLIHNYFIREEKIISELNAQYEATKEPKLLAELNHVLNDMFDRLQSMGYIPKRKERIEFEGAVELKDWLGKFFKK